MLRLTIQEPWASALACLGKDCENRTWAPGDALLGGLVAFHAGLGLESWQRFKVGAGWARWDGAAYEPPEVAWLYALASDLPPQAGNLVGVAMLTGWVAVGLETAEALRRRATVKAVTAGGVPVWARGLADSDAALAVVASPWFMGPVAHVYAGRRPLPPSLSLELGQVTGSLGYRPLDVHLARRVCEYWRAGGV